jgi:hypothetical protein
MPQGSVREGCIRSASSLCDVPASASAESPRPGVAAATPQTESPPRSSRPARVASRWCGAGHSRCIVVCVFCGRWTADQPTEGPMQPRRKEAREPRWSRRRPSSTCTIDAGDWPLLLASLASASPAIVMASPAPWHLDRPTPGWSQPPLAPPKPCREEASAPRRPPGWQGGGDDVTPPAPAPPPRAGEGVPRTEGVDNGQKDEERTDREMRMVERRIGPMPRNPAFRISGRFTPSEVTNLLKTPFKKLGADPCRGGEKR